MKQRHLEERVRGRQRLEALAGGIAHDFNNLLTAITGYAEFALSGLGPDDPARNETILLVDDEDVIRGLARRVLVGQGYTVLEARNGSYGVRSNRALLQKPFTLQALAGAVRSALDGV